MFTCPKFCVFLSSRSQINGSVTFLKLAKINIFFYFENLSLIMPEEDINESVTEEDGYVVTTVTTSMTVSLNSPDTSDKYQVSVVTKIFDNNIRINFKVQYEDRCGRMLVATKFISAGETIFTDEPACMGPDNNPRPVCLVCCARLVRGYVVTCDNCGWPLCSETCRENLGQHVRECSLFKSTDTKLVELKL